jgi:hypothetical protein
VFLCDACDEVFEVTENLDNFAVCWRAAKEEGWRIYRGDHLCPECAKLAP